MSESTGNKIYDKLTPQRKQLVDEILKNLENGTGLWRQGWQNVGSPVSAITGKRYNGVNRLFLTAAMMQRGYSDNRWLTWLNRKMGGSFGTPEYAEEELRAEIASMFIEQDLEIAVEEKHIQNNSAYIKG